MKSNQLIIKTKPFELKAWALLLAIIGTILIVITPAVKAQEVHPVLEFPQMGLDDASTYRDYTTRFYRDSEGNTIQISINQNTGRIMNIWADAVNESISFTVRDTTGHPAYLVWDSQGAKVFSKGAARYVQYQLLTKVTSLDLGLFILGSMRIERDFGYQNRHSHPFDSEPFIVAEFISLIDNVKKLPASVQVRHLALLNAESLEELYSRLVPQIKHQSNSQACVFDSILRVVSIQNLFG